MTYSFTSYDGTRLGYRVLGSGQPLVCLPGDPGRAGEYLGNLGGLDAQRRLIVLDPRGVGLSADPVDPATFRADRLIDDVESLRVHLGLQQMDLLAHSAGGVLATLYAAAHPERLSRLVLVTPGLAREHASVGVAERHQAAREGYGAGITLDPTAVQATLKNLTAPVLLLAGKLDSMVTPAMVRQAAALLPNASVVVQETAAHFPWVDDAAGFTAAVLPFLD